MVPAGEVEVDLEAIAAAATYLVEVDDTVVVGGHSPAFGLHLSIGLRRTVNGRAREMAGLSMG